MKLFFYLSVVFLLLCQSCKKDALVAQDYTELRAHVRGFFEVFALSEIITNQFEFNVIDSFYESKGMDSFYADRVFPYEDGRDRKGKASFSFKNALASDSTVFTNYYDYYRDSIHITGKLVVAEISRIPGSVRTKKSISGALNFKYINGTVADVSYSMIQTPTSDKREYIYSGSIHTHLNNGKTASTIITVPIKNTGKDPGGSYLKTTRPYFGQGILRTSSQKGSGVLIFGYDKNGYTDDFLYIGFPDDNDLQLNMRMANY